MTAVGWIPKWTPILCGNWSCVALLPPAVDLRGGHGKETPLWFMFMCDGAFDCSGFMYLLGERLHGIFRHRSYGLAPSQRGNPATSVCIARIGNVDSDCFCSIPLL
ncbi:hypothetical protein BD779DRAFT_1518137 [Infundibulicybe gibba]|nr:hypothetical protein BD779DRAFT_1518137 [Infundibulicybe gibba]